MLRGDGGNPAWPIGLRLGEVKALVWMVGDGVGRGAAPYRGSPALKPQLFILAYGQTIKFQQSSPEVPGLTQLRLNGTLVLTSPASPATRT
jgi:hypothetical protein